MMINMLRLFLSVFAGGLSALLVSAFVLSLNWATQTRHSMAYLLYWLPAAGLMIGLLYHRFGKKIDKGQALIFDEIHSPQKPIPARMLAFIFSTSILSHLFGASVGREGAAIQIGASVSDQLSRFFKFEQQDRKILITCGLAAGFSAALGTPLAGALFATEVISGRWPILSLAPWTLIASYTAMLTTRLIGFEHTLFHPQTNATVSAGFFLAAVCIGLLAGVHSHLYHALTRLTDHGLDQLVRKKWLRPLVGGVFLSLLYLDKDLQKFAGLGIEQIQAAFIQPVSWTDAVFKMVLTVISVTAGFRGGEFIPIVFIGTHAAASVALLAGVSQAQLVAIGFCSFFAALSRAPFASSLICAELFGWTHFPAALAACFLASVIANKRGLYSRSP